LTNYGKSKTDYLEKEFKVRKQHSILSDACNISKSIFKAFIDIKRPSSIDTEDLKILKTYQNQKCIKIIEG